MLWTRGGGLTPIRWMWVVLLVDVFVIGSVTLIAGASAEQSWTADILVNGLFLVPMLAATQLDLESVSPSSGRPWRSSW